MAEPLMSSPELFGTSANWLVPLKVTALPVWPAAQAGKLLKTAVLPLPEASAALVPLLSSSFHQATGPARTWTLTWAVPLWPLSLASALGLEGCWRTMRRRDELAAVNVPDLASSPESVVEVELQLQAPTSVT